MFERMLVEDSAAARRSAAFLCSVVGQGAILASLLLVSLVRTDAIFPMALHIALPAPRGARPAASKPVPASAETRRVPVTARTLIFHTKHATATPTLVLTDEVGPLEPAAGRGGVVGAAGLDAPCPCCTGQMAAPPPPPKLPAEPKKPAPAPKPVPVGGDVQAAKLIYQPKPVYPPLARQARISGVVRLEAIISRDGLIQNLRIVSGHPLLVPAAQDAVRRWRYQPTLLNGAAVEVITQIEVNFTLTS